jgi:hypothetical protein
MSRKSVMPGAAWADRGSRLPVLGLMSPFPTSGPAALCAKHQSDTSALPSCSTKPPAANTCTLPSLSTPTSPTKRCSVAFPNKPTATLAPVNSHTPTHQTWCVRPRAVRCPPVAIPRPAKHHDSLTTHCRAQLTQRRRLILSPRSKSPSSRRPFLCL